MTTDASLALTESPYSSLPGRQFWRSGVVDQHALSIANLYSKKYEISRTEGIVTAGSCFAQHIATQMRKSGYNVLDAEPAPSFVKDEAARAYGYRQYSGRYGNIYTVRQLLQLVQEACGLRPLTVIPWKKGPFFVDALRPSVEPRGLRTVGEISAHRDAHVKLVRHLFNQADIFIFTLGLTEAWVRKACGTVMPTAPGTIAGVFDHQEYAFKNFSFGEIYDDFMEVRDILQRCNPKMKFLLTVSPVPLTATACDEHVLQATGYSKSVLRAVAGQLYHTYADIDYFPSYELVASHFSKGIFYEPNLRSVSAAGVQSVMRVFFLEHGRFSEGVEDAPVAGTRGSDGRGDVPDDVVCEEALLDAFSK